MGARVEIKYCVKCKWLLRSAWMAQELLSTFEEDLAELVLIPASGGIFEISVNDRLIWSREQQGGFPDVKQLKILVRNEIAPEKDLGHIEGHTKAK